MMLHVMFKGIHGSGLTVVNQISKGNLIYIEPLGALQDILKHSKPGDKIVFHGRKSFLDSMAFLLYNGIFERNHIIYNPHTNL